MKKFLALVMALVMCMGLAALADPSDPIINTPGTYPISNDPTVTLSIGINNNADILDYEDNYLTHKLEELAGINDIKVEVFPSGDSTQKLTMMVTGGQKLPDILAFAINDDANRNLYAEAGALVALDDYFADKTMSAAFYAKCESEGVDGDRLLNLVRSADGHIYSFPYYSPGLSNIYSNRSFINQKWLDALGLEAPKTIDELVEVLKAFRDEDPNGNGINDEIPMSGAYGYTSTNNTLNWLLGLFIYNNVDANRYLPMSQTGGVIDVAYDKPEYREYLKFVKMLIEERLLDEAALTQDLNTMRMQLKAETETIGMMCGSASGFGDNIGSWAALEQPVGYNGLQQVMCYAPKVESRWSITTSCEHPELAFMLGMAGYKDDELRLIGRYGEENVDWRRPVEGEVSLFGEMQEPDLLVLQVTWGKPTTKHWCNNICPAVDSINEVFGGNKLYNEYIHAQSVILNSKYSPAYEDHVNQIIFTSEEVETWGDIRATINKYVESQSALFYVGQLDPESDADWENYLAGLEALNYKEMLAADTIAYNRTYGK